jgi:hypothetical protein
MFKRLPAAYAYNALAIAAACCTFLIARANVLTFPYPWNDEARFFLPAWWLSAHGSLSPTILNAPHGIFWVPDGFYVWLACIFSIFGRSVNVARVACELSVALGVALFAIAFRKITRSSWIGAAATTVLLTPPTILAANMIRMEAPVFLIFAIAILFHIADMRLACASMLFLSLLFHPAFFIALVLYLAAVSATRNTRAHPVQSSARRILAWLLFAVVAIAAGLELIRIVQHFPLVRQHMSIQETRKAGHSFAALLIKPQGILLGIEIILAAWLAIARRPGSLQAQRVLLLPVAAAALGVQIYAVFGGEVMYDVYSLAMTPAIFLCLAYCLLCGRLTPEGPITPESP